MVFSFFVFQVSPVHPFGFKFDKVGVSFYGATLLSGERGVFWIKGLPDSVMVAHKILILGVQVRTLVGQIP